MTTPSEERHIKTLDRQIRLMLGFGQKRLKITDGIIIVTLSRICRDLMNQYPKDRGNELKADLCELLIEDKLFVETVDQISDETCSRMVSTKEKGIFCDPLEGKFYFSDEAEQLNGPFSSMVRAITASTIYAKHL